MRFIGFLHIAFEGNAIYLHRDDFEHAITRNALWIDIPRGMTKPERDATNLQYVICAGLFRADKHGHLGMFSAEVTAVTRLETWVNQRKSE